MAPNRWLRPGGVNLNSGIARQFSAEMRLARSAAASRLLPASARGSTASACRRFRRWVMSKR